MGLMPHRPAGRRLLSIVAATTFVLMMAWASLLATADPLTAERRKMVTDAVDLLDRQGFTHQAWMLRHVVVYRGTDNWWNLYTGHQQAYAATNFPFEVVTLYRPFFTVATDDVERAAILLHESHHLLGSGETTALRETWVEKQRLGWTSVDYGRTRLWKNTREWTAAAVPDFIASSE